VLATIGTRVREVTSDSKTKDLLVTTPHAGTRLSGEHLQGKGKDTGVKKQKRIGATDA